jgi:cell division protein FtsQ
MKKKAKPTGSKSGQPRRRVVPWWRSPLLIGAMGVGLVALAAAGAWRVHQSGWLPRVADQARWQLIAASARLGLRVDEVLVVGRRETTHGQLLSAVGLARGAPILAFDLHDAKKRVEKLPWIKSATVERLLPSTVLLTVEERQPLALWQNKGAFALIDTDGEVILRNGLERFSDLLVVVGADAPAHAGELLKVLDTQPELKALVKAAVRVGGRRWNLRLRNDIDVRLPEENPAAAWRRLAEYEKTHRVLEHDVQILDLRLPDRLIVRKAPKPPKENPAARGGSRQET